ncbi:bifunctional ADP-dependent NAD(P)H-hydrate dehydratase/NAD(P)H-hydrate epimerase [Leptospira ognonensis]|uniref:Bifunctional NAD(P)H-hydrate repair enzyme n=1 Tax=Leptospira ognonensis TaxID=2484945 RepID=A0A4R9KAD4_9LEPT|nr:bifunctional ADP-dependent NAD(P)H-hydrate dehydratase/NAD(P)H-hydrate epimerase [Leptospira ognonensis]TGL62688.1 bifunctional ADP-dependent NAD(P)H-hydrate dehydratase/NAD(P)H-hydrate epimerase [Leptospira ognonensis]
MKVYPLYTNEEARALDLLAHEKLGYPETTLMGMAALAVFHANEDLWSTAEEIWIFAGTGGNGGDGYALANILFEEGVPVRVFQTGRPKRNDALFFATLCETAEIPMHSLSEIDEFGKHAESGSLLLVDAILGTGFKDELSIELTKLIQWINASNLFFYKLSLDSASGFVIDQPTNYVEADSIEELGTRKWENVGFTLGDKIVPRYYESIGFPTRSHKSKDSFSNRYYFEKMEFEEVLPLVKRKHTDHKYSAGSAIFFGGDESMAGALMLSSSAFHSLGGGISKLFTPVTSTRDLILQSDPSRMIQVDSGKAIASDPFFQKAKVIAVGPGLSKYPEFLTQLTLRPDQTLVLDAGAIPEKGTPLPKGNLILTPHAGEFQRLTGIKCNSVQSAYDACLQFCLDQKVHVLFKSHVSMLMTDTGACYVWEAPNAALATMGSGDLLVGILARFLSIGYTIPQSVYYTLSFLEGTREMPETYPSASAILQFLVGKV